MTADRCLQGTLGLDVEQPEQWPEVPSEQRPAAGSPCPRCGRGPLAAGRRCGWCGYRGNSKKTYVNTG